MIDIPEAHLQTAKAVLQELVPEYTVWAFGSRVTGSAKPFSDLDLAVITTDPLDAHRYSGLKEAFAESDLPFRVDVVDWAATNEAFRQIIQAQHTVVQTGPETSIASA